jgi:hypothetical protein
VCSIRLTGSACRHTECADYITAREQLPIGNIVVATADSAVLDRCPAWFNLARETIIQRIPDAWVLEIAAGEQSPAL